MSVARRGRYHDLGVAWISVFVLDGARLKSNRQIASLSAWALLLIVGELSHWMGTSCYLPDLGSQAGARPRQEQSGG